MNNIIQNTIGIILINVTNIYCWRKLLDNKVNFKSLKTYILFILMAIVTLANYFYVNQFIKILTVTIFLCIFNKLMFKGKWNKAIFSTVVTQMIYMISEIIFAFGLMYIFNVNPEDFVTAFFGTVITNFVICIIVMIIIQFKFIKKFYKFLLRITDKIEFNKIIILLFILMVAANIFTMTLYYDLNFTYIMIFNTLLTISCFIIIVNSMYNRNKYIKVYDKYNTTLNSLKEYEDILDRYRILSHENKNQLLTIRNMIPKTSKKTINYIDTIVENKLNDSNKVMHNVSKIPSGGLRGLIYSKTLLMEDLKISYELQISNDLRTTDLINNIDDSLMLDICKIIGVYLDNAIQAVQDIKNKNVVISMCFIDKYLEISISNTYEGIIEIEKLEDKGYSSKGKGHGYGLALAKEIIQKNSRLSNEKSISKNVFTQVLKIKM